MYIVTWDTAAPNYLASTEVVMIQHYKIFNTYIFAKLFMRDLRNNPSIYNVTGYRCTRI